MRQATPCYCHPATNPRGPNSHAMQPSTTWLWSNGSDLFPYEWSKNVERWIYSHGLQYERLRFVQSLSPKWRGSLLNCAAHVTNTLPALVPNSLTKDTFPLRCSLHDSTLLAGHLNLLSTKKIKTIFFSRFINGKLNILFSKDASSN